MRRYLALGRRGRARARAQDGIGLVEVLIAMTFMAIGILATFGLLQSGISQIRHASTTSTAAALAEAEMESYRAIRYDSIGLVQADIDAISSTDEYKLDSAYLPASLVTLPACGAPPCTTSVPVQTLTGADGLQYRVDTFVSWRTVTNGRNVKLVTIIVRDGTDTTRVWNRLESSFDESTGL